MAHFFVVVSFVCLVGLAGWLGLLCSQIKGGRADPRVRVGVCDQEWRGETGGARSTLCVPAVN